MKPKPFKVSYYDYVALEKKKPVKIDGSEFWWQLIDRGDWGLEKMFNKAAQQYPGRTVICVHRRRCSNEMRVDYLMVLQKTLEEVVTEALEGK